MRIRLILALAAACPAPALMAQTVAPPAAAPALPSNAAADVVRDVIRVVRTGYVFPDRVPAIVRQLEAGLASGRYATPDPAILAERMSTDLRESSGNDGHMYINYNPAEAQARAQGDAPGPADQAFFQRQMQAANHGVTGLKVLPGNVRYMNLSQWFWDPKTTPRVYDDAMRFLRDGEAIIIDIRRNGGGSAEAVNYVTSHFMEPGRKLITFRDGPTEVEDIRTQRIASGRITGKPLFVLIGPASGSASEEFASHIRHFELGTLVGQTTAGAGNPNSLFAVAHGFVVSISSGEAIHPVTNKGWEGEGVAPHVRFELERALDAAHAEALKTRLASAEGQERQTLQWLIAALSDEGPAAPLPPATMASFAGRYEGDRQVTQRAGRLYWKRTRGPEVELVPLGGSRFAVGDRFGTRVEFDANGAAIQIVRPDGGRERLARVASS